MRQATAEPEESVAKEATVNETDEDAVNETQEEKTEEDLNEQIGKQAWAVPSSGQLLIYEARQQEQLPLMQ